MEYNTRIEIIMILLNVFRIVYKIGRSEPFKYEDFGHWGYGDGLVDSRSSGILARRRRNLRGHRLRAATVFLEPGSENHTDLDDYQFVDR